MTAEQLATVDAWVQTRTSFRLHLRDGSVVWADASSPTEWLLQQGSITAWGSTLTADEGPHSHCIVLALRDAGGRVTGSAVAAPGEIDWMEPLDGEEAVAWR